jgi:RecA-family ATPase
MHAKPERPVTLQGDLRKLPAALVPLKALPNWVCWHWEWRVDRKGAGKWTKPPLQPRNPSNYARNNDSTTWGAYEEALAVYEAGQCDGIGFCLAGTMFACFDLDNSRDSVTGEIAPEAMAYVDRAASYTEISVSGTGLHVIGFGSGAKIHRKHKIPRAAVEIETYRGCERYIVITGNPLLGLLDKWPHLVDIGDQIDAVVAELDGAPADQLNLGQQARKLDGEFGNPDDGVDDMALPDGLIELIEYGASPTDDLSAIFHHVVCWLADYGWGANRIERRIAGNPIVPERYASRLGQEIARCLGKRKPRAEAHDQGSASGTTGSAGSGGTSGTTPPPPLPWLDMSNWDHEPVPEREWAIRDRVPLRQVGLFSGEGGTGKSIIELMKNVAHVAGKDWFGSLPEPGPAFYLGAEDDDKELHARLAVIAKHYGVTFETLVKDGLHVLPLGEDAVMCAVNPRSGRLETTTLYHRILEAAGDIKPKNISIDTLSLFFAGNEINRVEVYAFAMYMRAIARVANGSVTVLSHPSLAGMATGSGLSGSTAWHGAFRFRQYLKGVKDNDKDEDEPDNGLRKLEFKKNQYGPRGQSIVLRYENGLFLPEAGPSSLDKLAKEARADRVFMDLLERFAREGRNVSHSKTANNYAPTTFARESEAKTLKLGKDDFEDAMQRLFAANKIRVEPYGPPSRGFSRLVARRKPAGDQGSPCGCSG